MYKVCSKARCCRTRALTAKQYHGYTHGYRPRVEGEASPNTNVNGKGWIGTGSVGGRIAASSSRSGRVEGQGRERRGGIVTLSLHRCRYDQGA